VLGWLDSDGVRVAAYLFATAVALTTWWRERRQATSNRSLWPTFWLLTAAVFAVMAIGRATNLSDLITRLGRDQAYAGGWYNNRRRIQAAAIAVVGAAWVLTVGVAVWRVPARRRRYLPAFIAQFTLVCFVGVRMISLHQVDSLMYRRHIAGAEAGTVAELVLLAIAVVLTAWPPPAASARPPLPTRPASAPVRH
jgi:hypothetical protein